MGYARRCSRTTPAVPPTQMLTARRRLRRLTLFARRRAVVDPVQHPSNDHHNDDSGRKGVRLERRMSDKRPRQAWRESIVQAFMRVEDAVSQNSTSTSTSPSAPSPACSRSAAHRRRRRGARSSPTMSGTWSPSTSSPFSALSSDSARRAADSAFHFEPAPSPCPRAHRP